MSIMLKNTIKNATKISWVENIKTVYEDAVRKYKDNLETFLFKEVWDKNKENFILTITKNYANWWQKDFLNINGNETKKHSTINDVFLSEDWKNYAYVFEDSSNNGYSIIKNWQIHPISDISKKYYSISDLNLSPSGKHMWFIGITEKWYNGNWSYENNIIFDGKIVSTYVSSTKSTNMYIISNVSENGLEVSSVGIGNPYPEIKNNKNLEFRIHINKSWQVLMYDIKEDESVVQDKNYKNICYKTSLTDESWIQWKEYWDWYIEIDGKKYMKKVLFPWLWATT